MPVRPREGGGVRRGRQVSEKAAGVSERAKTELAAEVRKVASAAKFLPLPRRFLQASRARRRRRQGSGRGARTMAAAPVPARVPTRLHYRVQLRFVTEEQLFAAGPLSPPNPKSLWLEVHPAGEEADATVTDGEVLARPTRANPAWKLRPLCARVEGAVVWKGRAKAVWARGALTGGGRALSRGPAHLCTPTAS